MNQHPVYRFDDFEVDPDTWRLSRDGREIHLEPVVLGDKLTANCRSINKYIHPDGVQSCQLVMGVTRLEQSSVWNTMPTHTHQRRMEAYFYFDVADDHRVFYLMGTPEETRHLILGNHQAVISPR